MEPFVLKERMIRVILGRLRAEVYGLKGNQVFCLNLEQKLGNQNGVLSVKACPDTGRILVNFDEKKISVVVICQRISELEEDYFARYPGTLCRFPSRGEKRFNCPRDLLSSPRDRRSE